jgi:zinc protease
MAGMLRGALRLLLILPVVPQHAPATEFVQHVERLANGLRVVLVEDCASRQVSVQFWFDVGSGSDEPPGSGLCEVYRRSLTGPGWFGGPLAGSAVRGESGTLSDAWFFATTVPVGGLETELCRHAGLLGVGRPTRGAVGLTRWKVRREGWQAAPFSDGQWQALLATAFPQHPYGHLPGGEIAAVRSTNPRAVNERLSEWSVPANATLVVVGALRTDDALRRIRQRFGCLPWTDVPPRARPAFPPAELVHLPPAQGDSPGLDLAWVTPGAAADELAALDVLMHMLCNPVDGPLNARLTAAGCRPPHWTRQAWREAGLLVLSVDLEEEGTEARRHEGTEGRCREIERIVGEELALVIERPPGEVALNRARALAARDVRNRRASFHDWALELGWSEVVAGDVELAAWELPRREQLRVGDVQRAAALLRDTRTVVRPRVARTGGGIVRPAPAGHFGTPPKRTAGHTPVVVELGNGVAVRIFHVVDAGPTVVETRVQGAGDLAPAIHALLAAGSIEFSTPQLRDYLSYHGLDLSAVCEKGRTGLISRGAARDVPQMVELQALLLQRPDRSAAALAALGGIRRVDVRIIGDIEPQAAEAAVRAVWEDWRQYNPPLGVLGAPGVWTPNR